MEFKERTNLWRATAQILEWTYGLTNLQFDIASMRLSEVPNQGDDGDETHYAFEVRTNEARLTGLRHPLALVVESYHIILTGVVKNRPTHLVFDERIAEFEIDDMLQMPILRDNGGFSTVSVQVKITRFDGGEDSLPRHFLFRNNLLHLIR